MTHICVGNITIIGSDNGLSPGCGQAIIWTNVGILLIGPLWINFNEILIENRTFSFKKIHLKMSSVKWRPFCLGLNVLIEAVTVHVPDIIEWIWSNNTHVSVHTFVTKNTVLWITYVSYPRSCETSTGCLGSVDPTLCMGKPYMTLQRASDVDTDRHDWVTYLSGIFNRVLYTSRYARQRIHDTKLS